MRNGARTTDGGRHLLQQRQEFLPVLSTYGISKKQIQTEEAECLKMTNRDNLLIIYK